MESSLIENPRTSSEDLNRTTSGTPSAIGVAILLCTYNGAEFLGEQLESINAQSYSDWKVFVSDDGSVDSTLAVLNVYQEQWGAHKIAIGAGPRQGFAKNFLSLICNADIEARFYAFADQDDIWVSDKLQRAVQWLDTVPAQVPAMYCTRTALVDRSGSPLGLSPLFTKSPSFKNAVVQSLAGGNTMVFNAAARRLLMSAGPHLDIVTHDWWAYIVISACGGTIRYDEQPSLLYRQHGGNQIGSNNSWAERLIRIRLLFKGRFKEWNDRNAACIERIHGSMTTENQQVYHHFVAARKGSLWTRLKHAHQSGFYRQTFLGNLGLLVAIITAKL